MNRIYRLPEVCFALTISAVLLPAQVPVRTTVQRVNFNSPEGWALKYFTSATSLSGLQPAPSELEERKKGGAISVGLELGWLPELTNERAQVGFTGRKIEDLNKAPILVRPTVRVGLPWRFTAVIAGPPPIEIYGVTPRLVAFGLERPILERGRWRLAWRGSGQLGYVRASFTCPQRSLGFPAGSPENPAGCVGVSDDTANLHYGGTELQVSTPVPGTRRMSVHGGIGANVIDSSFQLNAPLATRQDRTTLWARGFTFNGTAGVSYRFTRRASFTVDAFYSPLMVKRDNTGPAHNDGLFNVRGYLSYSIR